MSKIIQFISYIQTYRKRFSHELQSLFVISFVGFAQGLMGSSDTALSFIYKDDFGLSPTQSSFFGVNNQFPWLIKPLWGTISDNFSFFGYRRKSYMIMMAIVCWFCLMNFGIWVPPVSLGFVLLFMHNVGLSFESCMAQAVIVETSQVINRRKDISEEEKSKAASNGVSMFFGARYTGSIIGAIFVMCFLQESKRREYMFWISFVPLILLAVCFILPEKRNKGYAELTEQESKGVEMQLYTSKDNSIANIDALETDREVENPKPKESNFKKTLTFLKNPVILRAVLLMFLSSFAPQSPQAKFFYYTNYLNFDAQFLGSLDFIGISAILISIFIYNRYLTNLDLKKFYAGTILLAFVLTLAQLILMFRINVALGISDKFFAAIDSFIMNLVLEFNSLPVLVLACRICPKDIEATVFALLLSVSNAGGGIALQIGSILTHVLGITADNFDNLWILNVITAVFYLVPLTILSQIQLNMPSEDEKHNTSVNEGRKYEGVDHAELEGEKDLEDINEIKSPEETDMELKAIKEQIYATKAADEKTLVFN